tara:strand:- start:3953 stop:4291 length:339 start_codon:yes stop_codon:yes gene_type:complete
MFKAKFIISTLIFIILLIFTSLIKNETRIVEKKISKLNSKIFLKKKDINETQLDFYYLTSPSEIEKKLDVIGYNNYQPIEYSNIFLNFSDFTKIKNKISNLNRLNEKKIQKK